MTVHKKFLSTGRLDFGSGKKEQNAGVFLT